MATAITTKLGGVLIPALVSIAIALASSARITLHVQLGGGGDGPQTTAADTADAGRQPHHKTTGK